MMTEQKCVKKKCLNVCFQLFCVECVTVEIQYLWFYKQRHGFIVRGSVLAVLAKKFASPDGANRFHTDTKEKMRWGVHNRKTNF